MTMSNPEISTFWRPPCETSPRAWSQREIEARKHLEWALALTATVVLAALWGGAPYQGRLFFLFLLIWTPGIALATGVYAIAKRRWSLLSYTPVFFLAVFGKELLVVLFLVGGALCFSIAALIAVVRPTRSNGLLVGHTLLIAVTAFYAVKGYLHLRDLGAWSAAERGNEIVAAINEYEKVEGKLPDTLEDLVPRQLAWVPATGMMGYPSFEYIGPVNEAAPKDEERRFATYELRVNLFKFLQFDSLVYWPEGNYPDFMYGGWVERHGGWAYVHE